MTDTKHPLGDVALATWFGSAGISNWRCRSVRFALYLARRWRRAAARHKYDRRPNRFDAPRFIHDPDRPAVRTPEGPTS
jgi:hypothetical protein